MIDLAANPPAEAQTAIAFDAALSISQGARPGPRLLNWLALAEPASWNDDATARLVDVLLRGNDRGWRFLDTSGILVRALPEVAEAVDRWHRDPELIDPTQVVQFEMVDSLQQVIRRDRRAADVHSRIAQDDLLVLAALVTDLAGEHPPVQLVASLADRFGLDPAAHEELLALTSDHGLLRGVAGRADGLTEESALALAAHLVSAERTRLLYLLDISIGPLDPVARARLDSLLTRVLAALDGIGTADEPDAFGHRRAEAVRLAGADASVVDRIQHAPRPYLLTELPERVVGHARLLEPRPDRREVRVAIERHPSRGVVIDVVARDQLGLLAAVTEVFADRELDVVSARVATWGDGAALESFEIEPRPGGSIPADTDLADQISQVLGGRVEAGALADATVAFDDAGSPWYTLCEIRHVDQPALLATIAAGLALAGASVHAAELEIQDGIAIDRFSLTDRNGAKLRRDSKDAIRSVIVEGAHGRGRLGRLARR